MRCLVPMLAILLILAAGPATAAMSAGAEADCTLIQGRWICAWGEPDAVERDVFRGAVEAKI